jgi:predicted DNA-binding transcriptional regulator YafY
MPRSNPNAPDPRCARTRILQLLRMLPQHGAATTADLHRHGEQRYGWGVNLKTLKRDLELLEDLGLARAEERDSRPNAPRHWRAAAEGANPVPSAVAALLQLGRPGLDLVPPAHVASPLRDLLARSHARARVTGPLDTSLRFVQRVRVIDDAPLGRPELSGQAFDVIKAALYEERCVVIVHEDAAAARKSSCVEPRGLVIKGHHAFLVATDPRHGMQGLLYPLERVLRADPVDLGLRPGFDLDAFLEAGPRALGARQTPVRLQARVSARMAARLRREHLAAGQVLSPPTTDGSCSIEAHVIPDQPLLDFLCANAHDFVVEAPAALRARIRRRLHAAVGAYEPAACQQ